MAKNLVSTHDLSGKRVVGGKNGTKRIGKVRSFVFHPSERRCLGYIVKRPDLLLMFKRKDQFVSLDGSQFVDGHIEVSADPDAVDKAACKKLGVEWDSCVLWVGLPILTEDGTVCGRVGSVTFNQVTGAVHSIETDAGATANVLLGKTEIPGSLVKGFRRGIGAELIMTGEEADENEEPVLGALLVSDEVKDLRSEDGLADKAGRATAVAAGKVEDTVDKVKPKVSKAAKKTGEAVNKGAYATGRQIARSKGMFSAFKEEYNKARHDD